jgi:hypothetical protein
MYILTLHPEQQRTQNDRNGNGQDHRSHCIHFDLTVSQAASFKLLHLGHPRAKRRQGKQQLQASEGYAVRTYRLEFACIDVWTYILGRIDTQVPLFTESPKEFRCWPV